MSVDSKTREAIREAFLSGELRVRAVDPSTGAVGLHAVAAVLQHKTAHKDMVSTELTDGRAVTTTVDHSLFHWCAQGISPVETGALGIGDLVVVVDDCATTGVGVASLTKLPPHTLTYDLSVPGPENFMLSNGILAHNSYSIGGISLDIEKSSKYEGMKSNAEAKFDKAAEAKARTTKIMRGLRQPRFGMGVRSSFGPHVGHSVLSPRRFV